MPIFDEILLSRLSKEYDVKRYDWAAANKSYERLSGQKQDVVLEELPAHIYDPKLFINRFGQSFIRRALELCDAMLTLFHQRQILPMMVLSRVQLENLAFLFYVEKELHRMSHGIGASCDWEEVKAFVDKFICGMHPSAAGEFLPDEDPKSLKPKGVTELVRDLDKSAKGMLKRYRYLSELSHPNAMGCTQWYSRMDDANWTTRFPSTDRHVQEALQELNSLGPCLQLMGSLHSQIQQSADRLMVFAHAQRAAGRRS
ncbi:hypothetical protein [Roseibium sp.]|uniref:hypothetical protein n=1 Tax=Roseibium sp. TaxID=1936156 RepID=UPI003D11F235